MKKVVSKYSKLLLCFMAVLLVVTGCGCDKKDKTKANKKVESKVTLLDDQTVEGLAITGFSITYDKGISKVVANVNNTNAEAVSLKNIEISLYDKKGKLLIQTYGYIGDSIEANDNKQIITDVTEDLRSATKVEYKIAR